MCGFIVIKSKKITKEIKKSFLMSLAYLQRRGPDETRYIIKKNLLIGFTRLSINDIETGSQPFISHCKRYCIVFNGEIVNYKSLRNILFNLNVDLKFGHEAEIIVELFKIYGSKLIHYLRGFFSFVIVDLKTQAIFGAVDRSSIKPLYYFLDKIKENYIFTSDYSVLLKSGLVKKNVNFDKMIDFFVLSRQFNNKTIISKIKKLKHSSYFYFKRNKIENKSFWSPFSEKKIGFNYLNEKEVIKNLNKNFLDLLNEWKTSEEKISLCLSSGLDSSILNNYFKKLKIPIKKYSIFEGKKINANKIIFLNHKKIIKLINSFCKENFNPFSVALSSTTSLFQIYDKISKDKFKVTFNGEGSDEFFGGYTRYNRQLNLQSKGVSYVNSIIKIYQKEINLFLSVLKLRKFNLKKNLIKKIKSIKLNSKERIDKILEFDQLTWIPMLIQRHDTIGMYFGLEVRPPFLDNILIDYVNRLPTKYKFDNLNRKIILNKLIKKEFNHKHIKHKIGTPTIFSKILSDKSEVKKFKKSLNNEVFLKYFDINKLIKMIDKPKKKEIFLWRLYIFAKMLNTF